MSILAMAVCLAGVAATLTAWHYARARQHRLVANEFDAQTRHLTGAVEREVDIFLGVLQSLGPLHSISDRISPRDFEEFARKGLQYQREVLGPFGFAQRIPLSVRADLESADPSNALHIVEPGAEGRLQEAGLRPEYFPLTYQNPEDGLRAPNGFDLAVLPGQAEALARMRMTGAPAMGATMGPTNDPSGFLICAPIQDPTAPEGAPGQLSGFTAAVLWPQDLLRRALDKTMARDLLVTIFDPRRGEPDRAPSSTLSFEAPLRMVDQAWRLRCEALPAFAAGRHSPLAWLVLAAGLAVTILLTLQILLLASRTARIEETVHQRTAELSAANRQLSEEMEERVRLENEVHAVTTREKQRIGQDLHDSLGQKLTGAMFLSRALAGQLPDAAEARDSAQKINAILKDAVAQVRRTARGLAPVDVGEDGLPQALRRLAEETCDVSNIACSFRSERPPRPATPDAATHLYHIAQEAVNNAMRHGGARDIAITLEPQGGHGLLVIADNGQGFAATAEPREGAGLRIMRHRARSIGGRLDIVSQPGGGVRVSCEFPTT